MSNEETDFVKQSREYYTHIKDALMQKLHDMADIPIDQQAVNAAMAENLTDVVAVYVAYNVEKDFHDDWINLFAKRLVKALKEGVEQVSKDLEEYSTSEKH